MNTSFISEVRRLRSSYRGTLSDIISKIYPQELDMDIDLSYTLDKEDNVIDSVQTEMRVIIPNLNPLDFNFLVNIQSRQPKWVHHIIFGLLFMMII